MVVVGPFGLAIFDGAELAVASSRERTLEFVELAWGPASVKGSDLYLLTDQETVLRVKAGAESFEELELPPVTAITSDEKGRIVYACVDEDDWTLDVHLFADPDLEVRHSVEAPAVMSDAYLAVQGGALAIGFPRDKVWLTRTVAKPHLACVEELSGGPVVFDGPGGHGALFGVAIEGNVTGLLRVAPDGTVARIGELGISGADASAAPGLVRQLAWDATRKTLWAAAGSAGVLSSTAPGAPAPGAGTAS
jgi:hypothetical protein